ncbi:MAG: nucleoside 2-deoxyribosyltransferase [Sarcina sp.]
MRKKIYNAGSLFTNKEQVARQEDQIILRTIQEKNKGFEFYNPLFNEAINDKFNNPTSEDIYNGDIKELLDSSMLAVDGDDIEKDPGVAFEVGMVAGINLMLEKIFENCSKEDYKKIVSEIPMKEVYVSYTDCRLFQDAEGIHKPVGFNQFVIGYFMQYANLSLGAKARQNMFREIEGDL